ncbi:superoxide dismutase family protein [Occallatibacter savannae]|uniref:superoxide dismutase family protein n=1 Tax=Occallatibacter savannae TaxID=1002691 RepID=UPI000D685471|nr:superoxide dismutase family protein [Occallatibacter savannae]
MRFGLAIAACALLAATLPAVAAGPKAAHAEIKNAQGAKIGTARFTSTPNGVKVSVKVSQLTPGEHGIHIHTVGKCEAPGFTTAGGHFNPTGAHHGAKNSQEPHPHVGDLENLTVGQNGKASATFTISGATLADGQNSLFHEGGTALVIHAKADDLMSDPSGNSGDRIACGVIER